MEKVFIIECLSVNQTGESCQFISEVCSSIEKAAENMWRHYHTNVTLYDDDLHCVEICETRKIGDFEYIKEFDFHDFETHEITTYRMRLYTVE